MRSLVGQWAVGTVLAGALTVPPVQGGPDGIRTQPTVVRVGIVLTIQPINGAHDLLKVGVAQVGHNLQCKEAW